MRHRKKFNHLGRKSAHRKETLSSMATALILHKRINTTLAKAKALRVYVEPLITKSKVDSTHSRRTVFSYLGDKNAVGELFREVAQKVADRPGGYTRILKTGFRKGDSAEMCFIELVDYNANMLSSEEETKQKTTRRGSRRRKPSDAAGALPKSEATPMEPKAVELSADEADAEIMDADVAEVAEEPTAEVAEEPTAEVAEVPTAEVAEEPIAEVVEEPTAEVVEEPTAEVVEEPADTKEPEVQNSGMTEESTETHDQAPGSEDEEEKK